MKNSLSLIHDNWYKYTFLATIDFDEGSISYKNTFPLTYMMTTAFILSPTVYYVGGYNNYLYTDQSKH
jgi:hypothetical protein